jgi:hypothetical protein
MGMALGVGEKNLHLPMELGLLEIAGVKRRAGEILYLLHMEPVVVANKTR